MLSASPNRRNYPLILLAVLATLACWRLLAAWHTGLELYADEAQYWSWSLQPDWGYYSKPPMVAWLIHLGTTLFGDAEMGVRAATFVLWPTTAGVLFLLVRRLFRSEPWGERAAFWSAVAFATLPMVSLGSWLITTDGPLLLFWTLSLYFLVRALETSAWQDWLLLGLAAGLGLMSKYSMVFFAPSLLLYLLLSPRHRALLLSPRLYMAAGAALLVVTPNLLWNARHHFVSYQHTAEISQLDKAWLHPEALLEFFLAQFGVFGPVLAFGLLMLAFRPLVLIRDERLRLLAAFSLVPLGAFLGLSLLSRAFANWAAFSYAAGAALVVVWWISREKRHWLALALSINLLVGATLYHYHDIVRALDIQLTRKTDPSYRITGYRTLGAEAAALLASHPGARLLGDDRKTFAALLYYSRPFSRDAAYLNPSGGLDNHYALSADIKDRPQGEFILVSKHADPAKLKGWFKEVASLGHIHVPVLPDYALDYQAWLVRDFSGY
jgi:4-amino-4-deoxy-L-arabinose transferase-like glycosyltransferase